MQNDEGELSMNGDFLDSLVVTITTYQTAFNTFLKENNYDIELARDLTNDWWKGVMIMAGLANQKPKDDGLDW